MAPIPRHPFCLWQTDQQGLCARAAADLACGREKADRAALGSGDGVQSDVLAALGSTDQTAPLVVSPPFSTAGRSPCGLP
jgi:hypothetical protein